MRPREAAVMRNFLKQFEDAYDHFDYNVRIGPSRDVGPDYPDYVRKMAMQSSQLRLDAIAWDGDHATLIELKHYAWPGGVQQLALYGMVWAAENPQLPKPKLLLVCTGYDASVVPTAAAAGVTVQLISAN
jgi:hypothetical protein